MKTVILALGILCGLAANPAGAAERPSAAEQAEAAHTLEIARRLASYGETKGDALALITAARMIAAVPGTVQEYGGGDGSIAERQNGMDPRRLIAKAQELAPDEPLIAALVGGLQTELTAASRDTCYWEYYCYWHGECKYVYHCW